MSELKYEETIEIAKKMTKDYIITCFKEEKRKEGIFFLINFFLKKYKIMTLGDDIYIYNDFEGIYEKNEELIKKEIQEILSAYATNHIVNEVIEAIKRLTYKKNVEEEKNKICLKNGILDLQTFEFQENYFGNGEIIFFNKIPVRYDPNAKCSKYR